MGVRLYICLLLAAALLCACTRQETPGAAKADPAGSITDQTVNKESGAEDQLQQEDTPDPLHSALYIPGCSQEKMLEYFEEIVLDIEYTDGTGNASLVQKWTDPLRYRINGTPTDEDRAVLTKLFEQLNNVPGFPGIYPAGEGELENLTISFLERAAFNDQFSGIVHGEYANGATEFWYYTASNQIHTARIGYCTDVDQQTRNSILLEEIINTLGVSDTTQRADSIVYQYSDSNLTLSDVDWIILKLLYDPAIRCGMDKAQCRTVIEQRYY